MGVFVSIDARIHQCDVFCLFYKLFRATNAVLRAPVLALVSGAQVVIDRSLQCLATAASPVAAFHWQQVLGPAGGL